MTDENDLIPDAPEPDDPAEDVQIDPPEAPDPTEDLMNVDEARADSPKITRLFIQTVILANIGVLLTSAGIMTVLFTQYTQAGLGLLLGGIVGLFFTYRKYIQSQTLTDEDKS